MPARVWSTAFINQLIIGLIILAPPLEVLVGGRSLYGEDPFNDLQDDHAVFLLRSATILIVVLSSLVILMCLVERRRAESGIGVMVGFVAFFVTNVLLCVPFGAGAFIDRSHFYPLLVFLAFYLSSEDGSDGLIDAAKWCLLVMMVASLICGILMPEVTRRVYEPEVRLPFIDFRFWGLGEHANAIAPLGLLQVLLTLYRPFNSRALTVISLVAGFLIALLAQSQTVWVIGLVALAGYVFYRNQPAGLRLLRAAATPIIVAPTIVLTFVALVAVGVSTWQDAQTPGSGAGNVSETMLTGRGDAWNAAIDTFWHHPIFGYGLLAWDREFRENVHLPWAVHAHNQLLQSLSVAGIVGAFGLVLYVGILIRASVAAATATRWLAPAILLIILVRTFTEVPLNLGAVLVGDTIAHLLLFRLVTAPRPLAAVDAAPAVFARNWQSSEDRPVSVE